MRRIVIVALAAAAGALLGGHPWVMRQLGGAPALVFDVKLPDGADRDTIAAIWRARLSRYDVKINGPQVTVEGAGADDASEVTGALTESGSLEIDEVLSDERVSVQLYKAARSGELGPDVVGDTDPWRQEDTTAPFYDYYLRSHSIEALIEAIGTVHPPAGSRFVFEEDIPPASAKDREPYWRSYLIGGGPIVDQTDIEDALTIWDSRTNRPEVLITLDDAGRARFAEATRRLVGHKIAILRDGDVVSAPVIQGAISGGRANISMGGGDVDEAQRNADELVGALRGRGPPLPPGITAVLSAVHGPPSTTVWSARGIGAIGFSLLGVLLVTLAARGTTEAPGVPRTRNPNPARLALALAITIAVPVILWLAERITVPGLAAQAKVKPDTLALRLWPGLAGYVAGELFALLIPAWRASRRLQPVASIVTLAVAILVAHRTGARLDAVDGRVEHRYLVELSLVAGAMLYVVGARLITRAGVCNGWLLLLAIWYARDLTLDATVLGGACAGATLVLALIDARVDGRRQPLVGLAPLLIMDYLLGALRLGSVVVSPLADVRHFLATLPDWANALIVVAVAIAVCIGRSERRPLTLARSIAILPIFVYLPWSFGGAVLAIAALELLAGLRRAFRMGDAVALVETLDLDRADAIVDDLRAAGIPAVVAGARMRALRRIFAAWSPAIVYVPADRVDEARRLASPRVEPKLAEAAAVFD